MVSETFCNKFHNIRRHEVDPGHCLVLHMVDAQGKGFDIFGCYFPDYAGRRRDLMDNIRNHMNPASHTVVTGDFNFVHKGGDRYHFDRNPPSWADAGDSEAQHWEGLFKDDFMLHEIFQPRTTFHNTRWASRIDRVYSSLSNGRLAALQARAYVIERTSWSDHKPLAFSISAITPRGGHGIALAHWTFKSSRFPELVSELFQGDSARRQEEKPASKLTRLLWAMSTCISTS